MSQLKFYDQVSGMWVPVDGGATKVYVGSQAPAEPFPGQLWGDTSANDPQSGFTWTTINADQVLIPNTGYLLNNTGLLNLTLPTAMQVGQVIEIAGINVGLWKLLQNANQSVVYGQNVSTVGTGGYVMATNSHDSIKLVCITANTKFQVISGIGSVEVA